MHFNVCYDICMHLIWTTYSKISAAFWLKHEKCVYVMISIRLAGWVSVCGKDFNVAVFLDTGINMINIKLCSMVVHVELLPIHTTFSDLDCISRSQHCQTVLAENCLVVAEKLETLSNCCFRQVDHEHSITFDFCLFVFFFWFFFLHLLKGDNWHISSFEQKL